MEFQIPYRVVEENIIECETEIKDGKMMEVNEFKYLGTTLCKKKEQG